jgi:hypothetical protein
MPPPVIEPRFLGRVAHNTIAVPTVPHRCFANSPGDFEFEFCFKIVCFV